MTVVDVCQGKTGPFPFFFPDVQGNMFDPADMATYLTRWRIDPSDPATPVRVERSMRSSANFRRSTRGGRCHGTGTATSWS